VSRLLEKPGQTLSKHPDPKVSRMIHKFESACHPLSQKKPLLVVGEGVHGTSEGTKRSELFIPDLL